MTFKDILRRYIASWQDKQLIFSYGLRCSIKAEDLTLTLHQQQTGFSLKMTIAPHPDSLRISSFTINEDRRLEKICQPLYDAALIEMALQSLHLIVFCAQRLNKKEISFFISENDAANLTTLEDLFNSMSSPNTIHGKRKMLTLSTYSLYSDKFLNSLESMKAQLRQQLWSHQKTNIFLRKYLQNSNGRTQNILKNLLPQEKDNSASVISFPIASQHRTAI
jgi:hypothetical protein